MSARQRRQASAAVSASQLTTTMPPELAHRIRHHGKHHPQPHPHPQATNQPGDLWRWRSTAVADVVNATSAPADVVDRASASACYTTNEVLVIIALTCVLNLAFIVVVMSCVHFCSSPAVAKLSRLESLLLLEGATSTSTSPSESDLEPELEGRAVRRLLRLSPRGGRRAVQHYLRGLAAPSKGSLSSSMLSLQTLTAEQSPSSLETVARLRLDPPVTSLSLSMENLLFV